MFKNRSDRSKTEVNVQKKSKVQFMNKLASAEKRTVESSLSRKNYKTKNW